MSDGHLRMASTAERDEVADQGVAHGLCPTLAYKIEPDLVSLSTHGGSMSSARCVHWVRASTHFIADLSRIRR